MEHVCVSEGEGGWRGVCMNEGEVKDRVSVCEGWVGL